MIAFKWKPNKYAYSIVENYFSILVTIYISSVYFPFVRSGLFMSVILFILICCTKVRNDASEQEFLVSIFFLYSIFSIGGYFLNNIPLSAYWGDLSSQCFPIIFFFIAYHPELKSKFYKNFTISITVALLIGLYFYFFPNQYYIDFMVRTADRTYAGQIDDITIIPRFNSFFSSTATGTLSLYLISFSLYNFINRNQSDLLSTIKPFLLFVIGLLCALLTSQRSSMALALISPISLFIIAKIYNVKIDKTFTLLTIVVLLLAICIIAPLAIDYIDLINERLSSINTGYGDRTGQWIENFKHNPNLILGTGLGSVGAHAAGYAKYPIYDGAIFKYIAELGGFGFLIFVLILIRALAYKIKFIPILFREYFIIIVILLQSTASNTLSFQVLLPLFWYSIGVISSYKNPTLINYQKNGNNSILPSSISSYTR